jgi:hypothetical protein
VDVVLLGSIAVFVKLLRLFDIELNMDLAELQVLILIQHQETLETIEEQLRRDAFSTYATSVIDDSEISRLMEQAHSNILGQNVESQLEQLPVSVHKYHIHRQFLSLLLLIISFLNIYLQFFKVMMF